MAVRKKRSTARKGKTKKVTKTRRAAKTRIARAKSKSIMSLDFLRKELMVAGLFIVAGGILWLASELKMINIDPVAAPFLMIALGFIVAVTSLRVK